MGRKKEKFKFIDLFAGIGGIRISFEELGGRCVFSSEWDKHAQQTYASNFGEIPAGDITRVKEDGIPEHNILLAGFPCQPFSNAGHKKGFADTRGTLFFNIARIIRHHQPEMVLLENVKGFRNHDEGRTFRVIKNTLEKIGYEVFAEILNARNFKLPQNRERIYIVALNRKKIKSMNFKFPGPFKGDVRVGDILEKKVDSKYTISDRLWAGHKRRKKMHREKGNGFGYSLFNSKSSYTSTISARYYKDGSEILIEQKGKNPRKLTPREAARLQGFPEEFSFPVSDCQAYRQFGNSVAVPVIRAIAKKC
ncbi:MAG: DNA cytosine methyltransferase [Candidatus Saganbacteria bacterium]|nr:DNA cytosine methyltransferase [Candidatus Saganbacteria bacterium]